MTNTINRGYPWPRRQGDGADVSYWAQRLAEAVDLDVEALETTALGPLPWKPINLSAGWSAYTGGGGYYGGLRYAVLGSVIYLNGMVKNITTGSAGSVIATLPLAAKPAMSSINTAVANTTYSPASLTVSAESSQLVYQAGPANPSLLSINLTLPT